MRQSAIIDWQPLQNNRMPAITVIVEGDGAWTDLNEKEVINMMGNNVPPIQIAALPGGMASGKTSVTLRLDLPDGKVLMTETSFALLKAAVRAIEARYGQ